MKRVISSISDELCQNLDDAAKNHGISRSEYIAILIDEGLHQSESDQHQKRIGELEEEIRWWKGHAAALAATGQELSQQNRLLTDGRTRPFWQRIKDALTKDNHK